MRIIHTSDWHLGQNFMGKSRAVEHLAFFSWLLEQIKANKVDALIVAGDIFDTGSPPSYAREMYNRFVVDIHATNCQLIVLAGNHDSVATLNESKDLLACLNTQVIACATDSGNDPIISLKNNKNEIGAILCAVPFIRPRDVLMSQAGQSGQEKQQAMQQAISEHYHLLYQKADKLRKKLKISVPIIATGHLATVGASTTDSVRDIYIGTLDAFPASGFPPVDYLALGHIHQSQKIAKSEHLRYSGSPIALSFDESGSSTNKKLKTVLLVDFEKAKFKQATPLEVPCFQAMQVIKGDLKSIEEQLNSLQKKYKLVDGQNIWVEILVSSQDYLNDLQTRIQKMTESLPIEVLLIRRERKNQQTALHKEEKETLNELSAMDVFERRLSMEAWEEENEKERLERIKLSFKQVLNELEAGDVD